jgi:hypothetical protein
LILKVGLCKIIRILCRDIDCAYTDYFYKFA